MIEEWLTYIRAALKNDDLEITRRAIHQFVSKIVIANGEGDIYYTFPMPTSPQGRRHLGERSMDLRGSVPKTRQFYAFPLPEFPLNKHMDREALRKLITDLRADGWSLRQISEGVGLHFTWVRQILKH